MRTANNAGKVIKYGVDIMSRVIKYRAWDMGQKVNPNVPSCLNKKYVPKMVKVNAVYSENAIGFYDNLSYKQVTKKHYNFELMQFTGLCDQNGTEIYEGDIIKNSQTSCIFKIEYSEQHAGFRAIGCYSDKYLGEARTFTDKIEVIGNIFVNPELLKKGE